MIRLRDADLRRIEAAAEAAYPREACGLLVGRAEGNAIVVEEVVASDNIAHAADEFEVDPQVRIDTERRLRGCTASVVGLYHSHPDHPANPSARDAARAWEPELIWLITPVERGRAGRTLAHKPDPSGGFGPVAMAVSATGQELSREKD